jgi:RNA polymerase sigma-70 factor (ECF subfamily)
VSNDENVLIKLAQRGDHEAFLELLARYDRQIMSVVYRFTGDFYDRQDLYQEVFLHCFRSIRRFRFRSSFETWLYRIALNRCISYMKKKEPIAEAQDEAGHEFDWERRAKLHAIHAALSKMKGAQRICFHLHYIEDWSIARIAESIKCRNGTVKSHLNRARDKIRKDPRVRAWATEL